VQLFGSAQVRREAPQPQDVLEFRSEYLHAFIDAERVQSHLPVLVRQGGAELRAEGMAYDHLGRVVELKGRQRATFPPRGSASSP
jgi:lipopolysaccharide export system protein LptC